MSVFGQATGASAVSLPLDSTPSAVTVLNVEPGGSCAVSARSRSPPFGPFATARIAPSLTRTATRAERSVCPARAASAAFWVRTSSAVRIEVPGFASAWNSGASLPCTVTDTPGVPRSASS